MSSAPPPEVGAMAAAIAARLGAIAGVGAVVLGGSWARGDADPASDIDLGIYYEPTQPPDLAALRALAAELDDRRAAAAVTDFGEWGPWINGGAWLTIGGRRIDWLYRDLARVRATIADCRAGRVACHYQPGHPHGFHTPIYLGEIALCRPLHDPGGIVAALKAQALPFPPPLKAALIGRYLWEADFALETSAKAAARGDVAYVAGNLFRCVACLIQVLFALNEQFCINEKGAVARIETFVLRPRAWAATVAALLSQPGASAAELRASLDRAAALTAAVRAIAAPDDPAARILPGD